MATIFKPSILLDHYLDKMLALAQQESIPVYWYSAPFNQSSYIRIPKKFYYDHASYLDEKKDRFGLLVLNKLFALPDRYFGDPSHLYLGSERVTRHLMHTLKERLEN